MVKCNIYVGVCVVLALATSIYAVFISNLDSACMRCLCQGATGCNITAGCVKGYCGPFYISRIYWADADRYVLPEDDPERAGAFEDCALEYSCAKYMVENYMAKYGRDCNGDGVTDCDDYAMIHYNGGFRCDASLEGTAFHTKFTRCRPPPTTDDDELAQGDQPAPESFTAPESLTALETHAAPKTRAAVEVQDTPVTSEHGDTLETP